MKLRQITASLRLLLPLFLLVASWGSYASVSADGDITSAGQGVFGKTYPQLLPEGWVLKFADPIVASYPISWSVQSWSDAFNDFAMKNSVYLLGDATSKVIFATKSSQDYPPGLAVFSRSSPAASNLPYDVLESRSMKVSEADIKRYSSVQESVTSPQLTPGAVAKSVDVKESPSVIKPDSPDGNKTVKVTPLLSKSSAFVPLPEPGAPIVTTTSSVQVIKPLVSIQSQLEKQPPIPYLALVKGVDSRVFVKGGKLSFLVHKGSLESNIKDLLSYTAGTTLLYRVSDRHSLPNNFVVEGDDVLSIVDQLVAPFFKPDQVRWKAWSNNILIVYYKGDDYK